MKSNIRIILFLLVIVCLVCSCLKDKGVVTGNTNVVTNQISVTESDLIGTWTRCNSCWWGGPFLNKKIEFSDSGKIKIFENYNGGQYTFDTIHFAYGTYKIIGGNTLSMTLVYIPSYTLCTSDTIITFYKILNYRISQPYNIPLIVFEFGLTINNCNEPLGAGFCPASNPPRVFFEKKDTCM